MLPALKGLFVRACAAENLITSRARVALSANFLLVNRRARKSWPAVPLGGGEFFNVRPVLPGVFQIVGLLLYSAYCYRLIIINVKALINLCIRMETSVRKYNYDFICK